jgi:hypothetical protein
MSITANVQYGEFAHSSAKGAAMAVEANSGFSTDCRVVVEQVDDKNWTVRQSFSYTGQVDTFTVYDGMSTDFASVPRAFVWLLPRYGRYTKAAIVHDLLWREYATAGKMDWIDADGVFRRAMRELGVPFVRRWMMWAAVRWAALLKPGGWKTWWRESWRVLLVTAVVLPVVLPAALVVSISLGAFFLLETLIWPVLAVGQVVKRRRGQKSKRVITPTFDWKLG